MTKVNNRFYSRHFTSKDIKCRFKPIINSKNPCHRLIIRMNTLMMKSLNWDDDTRVNLYIPKPFKWWFFVVPKVSGYKSYTENYNQYYRITWPIELSNPRKNYYEWFDVESFHKEQENSKQRLLVINMSTKDLFSSSV